MGFAHAGAWVVAATAVLTTSSCALVPLGGGSTSGHVPPTTQRVYLATMFNCRYLDKVDVRFDTMVVEGDGYRTKIDAAEGCRVQPAFSTYVYDVPVGSSGTVRLTPGNQPTAELGVEELVAAGGATIVYAKRADGNSSAVTFILPGRDDEVGDAGSTL